MAKTALELDAKVVYYAEGNPYQGPFPALVKKIYPIDKDRKSEPADLDLQVFFGEIDGKAHAKTNVPFSLEPKKHHWSWAPADWKWPEPTPVPVAEPPATPEPK